MDTNEGDAASSKRTHEESEVGASSAEAIATRDTQTQPSETTQDVASAKRTKIEPQSGSSAGSEPSHESTHESAHESVSDSKPDTAQIKTEHTGTSGVKTEHAPEISHVSDVKDEVVPASFVKSEDSEPSVEHATDSTAQSDIKGEHVEEGIKQENLKSKIEVEPVMKAEHIGHSVDELKTENGAQDNTSTKEEALPHIPAHEDAIKTEDDTDDIKTEHMDTTSGEGTAEFAKAEPASASSDLGSTSHNETSEQTIERLKREVAAYKSAMVCSICSEVLVKPHSLECGHSYCVTCICTYFSVQRAMGRELQCKQCENPIKKKPQPSLVLQIRLTTLRNQPGADVMLRNYSTRYSTAENAMRSDEYKNLMPEADPVDDEGKGYIYDKDDDVYRCTDCLFEIQEYSCANCGKEFADLLDRYEKHLDLGGSDSEAADATSEEDEDDDGADLDGFIVDSDAEEEYEDVPDTADQPLRGLVTNASGLQELMCGCDDSCGQDCECDDEDCTACPCAQRNLQSGSGEDSDSGSDEEGNIWDRESYNTRNPKGGKKRALPVTNNASQSQTGNATNTANGDQNLTKAEKKVLKRKRQKEAYDNRMKQLLIDNGFPDGGSSLSKKQRIKKIKEIKEAMKNGEASGSTQAEANDVPAEVGFVMDRAGAYATEKTTTTSEHNDNEEDDEDDEEDGSENEERDESNDAHVVDVVSDEEDDDDDDDVADDDFVADDDDFAE